ncbi:DUF3488 and transglutaminase-like domain-containing protein [Ramlibacter sp. H39-3-26]|uniref:DUF3488 and transglutaminase-like domain-containing protein n=1 Tax=Curvibacter soli TaxID=3031331 RepID=UPI0023DB7537|nr:DUF3488 and transglutaminase-like domain-containing protein [Ramlibacter sp. H39-3-26]MDF1485084.1 DUF3488 and transglutaminase-like domain-containing protein [Ramlibacter sp. H39-3-26]
MARATAPRKPLFPALPRDSRDTLFLLAVVAWLILPQAANLPTWSTALAYALLAWRAWLAWHARALPSRWVLAGVLVLAIAGTLLTYRTVLGRDAGVTLVVLLLALKTMELRARRDALVIFFLGFFTMLTNFFYSQSLLTALAMLLGLLGLLAALVNAHMPAGHPPLAQPLRMAATMALLGAPIMAALFMLFPRLAPLWGTPSDAMSGRTGLSNSMQVGAIARIALDDAVAMRIRFLDLPAGTAPPQRGLYFRGPVLSTFDGREWTPLSYRIEGHGMPRIDTPAELKTSGAPLRYEATLEPHQRPWLLVLDAARDKPDLPGMDSFMAQDLQWMASRPITDVARYRAESYADFRHGPEAMTPRLAAYTELPPDGNPRTRALAQALRAALPADAGTQALVNAALQRLRTGGYVYTLDPGVYGPDTADFFWFDVKEGFCEHIASAFAVLMRAAGVPARIVTGYQGGEMNSVDGYWTVRQSDAHAWTEVWMEGRGWVRVDPTAAVAPARLGLAGRLRAPEGALASAFGTVVAPTLVQNLRAAWEAVNNRWNQWVLNYTQSRQMDLLRQLGFSSPSWEDLATVLGVLVAATASAAGLWTLWGRSRRDPWLRLLDDARHHLRQAGLQGATPGAAPRALAAQARARFGAAGEPVADWLLRLEQQRYARTPGAGLDALRRELASLHWPAHSP